MPSSAADPDLELTVLMPCLDEAETLASCIAKAQRFLAAHGVAGEVLVADNGSTDGSPQIAVDAGARVIAVPTRGYGAALIAGIWAARGRFVIMGDADDSYDFADLGAMLDQLRRGADLVMGDRFAGGIRPGAMPALHRYLGNPVLSFIGRLFFGGDIRDFHCGLRGFRRDSARALDLQTTGMEFASELVVKAVLARQRVEQVPIVLHPDGRSRPPHLRSWRDGWRHLRFLLLFSPRWLFLYPGIAMSSLGTVALLLLATGVVQPGRGRLSEGLLIAAGGFVIGGFQAMQFSVLARVFAETQRLLPPMRRHLSRLVSRLTMELGLLGGAFLVVVALVGCVVALLLSRHSDPGALVPSVAFRLGTCAVVAGVVGLQVVLGTTFLSILNLRRVADAPVGEPEPADAAVLTGSRAASG